MQHTRRIFCLATLVLWIAGSVHADRSVDLLTTGWRFTRGEQRDIARQPAFDDSAWQAVRVPHDWAIAGPFDERANGYAGKLPWQGQGWYRRALDLKQADAGKRVYLDFDGVMAFCRVYVNGHLAGQWDYGYSPFRVDATDFVTFGQTNTLAVQVDMDKWGTRWYPGAGIYRKVTLSLCSPVHIAHWGQVITTPTPDPKTVPNTVRVRTTLENHGAEAAPVTIQVKILDSDGTQVAVDERIQDMDANTPCEVDQVFFLASPRLWDIRTPHLYTAKTTVSQNGEVIDSLTSSFGVRTFEFTADDGFHLNGKRVQLYGVNLHHDQGPLGAAFHVRAMERQLEIMQDMGVNALRTSHNPPAAEVLDLCDRGCGQWQSPQCRAFSGRPSYSVLWQGHADCAQSGGKAGGGSGGSDIRGSWRGTCEFDSPLTSVVSHFNQCGDIVGDFYWQELSDVLPIHDNEYNGDNTQCHEYEVSKS